MENQDSKEKVNPEKKEKAPNTDLNLEEMGADQYDYGTGGPGAGRDDTSVRGSENSDSKQENDLQQDKD